MQDINPNLVRWNLAISLRLMSSTSAGSSVTCGGSIFASLRSASASSVFNASRLARAHSSGVRPTPFRISNISYPPLSSTYFMRLRVLAPAAASACRHVSPSSPPAA